MSLKIGDLAPDFKLFSKNTTGEPKEFSLSDYKGKNVVVLFCTETTKQNNNKLSRHIWKVCLFSNHWSKGSFSLV